MVRIGYTMLTEQAGPRELVDFSVIPGHYSPWLREQGHASYAWSVLGAARIGGEQQEAFIDRAESRLRPAPRKL